MTSTFKSSQSQLHVCTISFGYKGGNLDWQLFSSFPSWWSFSLPGILFHPQHKNLCVIQTFFWKSNNHWGWLLLNFDLLLLECKRSLLIAPILNSTSSVSCLFSALFYRFSCFPIAFDASIGECDQISFYNFHWPKYVLSPFIISDYNEYIIKATRLSSKFTEKKQKSAESLI